MTQTGMCFVKGILALVAVLLCGPVIADEPYSADRRRPVRSLLEIRREGVTIQTWDVSCGAAALAILLRYGFGEPVTEKEIARGLMRRTEYVTHPELLQMREGFSLLDLKRYVQGYGVQAAAGSYSPERKKSIRSKGLRLPPATSSKASQRARRSTPVPAPTASIYKGEGLGQLELSDLIERAPIMVPINALGYNHFVVFRGVIGNRVLIADPAWGNRTMTIDKFQRMWLDYGEPMGHVGFVVARTDGRKPNRLQAKPSEFVMLQ
jgi:predicted double-glycine peptidase